MTAAIRLNEAQSELAVKARVLLAGRGKAGLPLAWVFPEGWKGDDGRVM